MSDIPSIFHYSNVKEDRYLEKFTWSRGAGAALQKYEIHMELLESLDFRKMIFHCKDFERKVLRAVTTANQQQTLLLTTLRLLLTSKSAFESSMPCI